MELEVEWDFPPKLEPLFQPKRYKILYGGRGAAKSWGVARALLIRGYYDTLRILCARETQKSISESVHQLLKDQISALGLEHFYTVQETVIRGRNGTEFTFTGLRQQNVTSIKSYEGVDICWCEEAQVISKRSWTILEPTIRKRKIPGAEEAEIWITFNPELDTDETYTRFVVRPPEDAVLIPIGWRDNPWFPEVLEKERVRMLQRDPEEYENVWEGKPKTVVAGAIYRNEILKTIEDRRIRPVPYDPMLKVHTVWDLGWNDQSTIIFVQRVGGELRIIDYIEDSHKTYSDYVTLLEAKGYRYGKDYLPHDGRAQTLASGGKSGEEILTKLKRSVEIVPNLDVEQGIKQARLVFPRCYFDEDKTPRLVDCLKRYRRKVNQTTNEPGAPEHDEYSHGADAFRYLAIVADQLKNEDRMPKINYPKQMSIA
jgi:phage terminase large subunit